MAMGKRRVVFIKAGTRHPRSLSRVEEITRTRRKSRVWERIESRGSTVKSTSGLVV